MNNPHKPDSINNTLSRRTFLEKTALGAAGLYAGLLLPSSSAFAQTATSRPAGSFINPLQIPPIDNGRRQGNTTVYDLEIQSGFTEFFAGKKTPTRGINGAYLGTTLKMRDGDNVRLNVRNNIGETTTLHWHGLHLPASQDGGPHQPISNGTTWSPEFQVKQKAATFWYHSHQFHKTSEHVWQGIAGMIIVEDAESQTIDLPQEYGVDDIPIVLQDRRFDGDGQMNYDPSRGDIMMGLVGNTPMVNGTISPFTEAKSRIIRLRLLNGANASIYDLGFSDNRPFWQIGTDGGLLEAPYKIENLILSPGERAEILVAVSGGRNFVLKSRATASSGGMGMGGMMGGMMGGGTQSFNFLEIRPSQNLKASPAIPQKLVDIDWLNPSDAVKTRQFMLEMKMGPLVMLGLTNSHIINGKAMKMNRIDEIIQMGDTEIWQLGNTSPIPHPFHIHDIQFQILDRNGVRPHPGERGLKDTVLINPGDRLRVIAKFQDYADPDSPYMYHCHILEHEDAGMMGQFVVV